MRRASTNPKVTFFAVNGADHFSVLAPTNQLIAQRILQDAGQVTKIAFTGAELNRLFEEPRGAIPQFLPGPKVKGSRQGK